MRKITYFIAALALLGSKCTRTDNGRSYSDLPGSRRHFVLWKDLRTGIRSQTDPTYKLGT